VQLVCNKYDFTSLMHRKCVYIYICVCVCVSPRVHEYRCLPLQVHFFNAFDGYGFTVTVCTLSFTCSFLRTVIYHFCTYMVFFGKLNGNFGIKLSNPLTTQVMVHYLWQKFCMCGSLETKVKIILISPTALPWRLVTHKGKTVWHI